MNSGSLFWKLPLCRPPVIVFWVSRAIERAALLLRPAHDEPVNQ